MSSLEHLTQDGQCDAVAIGSHRVWGIASIDLKDGHPNKLSQQGRPQLAAPSRDLHGDVAARSVGLLAGQHACQQQSNVA